MVFDRKESGAATPHAAGNVDESAFCGFAF
jgi:hypothetical protein